MNEVAEQSVDTVSPQIGQPWPAQGGIYVGSRLKDGVLHHVVIPGGVEHDHADVEWGNLDQTINDGDPINGFGDWRAPDQQELMLAYINVPELFDKSGWYWSATPYGSGNAWAVDFEGGGVDFFNRTYEFRVRPFRSIIASSI